MDTPPPYKVHPEDSHKGELPSNTFVHSNGSVTELPLRMRPAGCLGRLEEIAVKLSSIQGTDRPVITEPYVVVFAADHGITSSHPDVSAFPREVTLQVVREFAQGRAAVPVGHWSLSDLLQRAQIWWHSETSGSATQAAHRC